jgi:hypothetical protein
MVNHPVKEKRSGKRVLDPHRLISDDEYGANLNALIAYYQIVRGEAKKRIKSGRKAA